MTGSVIVYNGSSRMFPTAVLYRRGIIYFNRRAVEKLKIKPGDRCRAWFDGSVIYLGFDGEHDDCLLKVCTTGQGGLHVCIRGFLTHLGISLDRHIYTRLDGDDRIVRFNIPERFIHGISVRECV